MVGQLVLTRERLDSMAHPKFPSQLDINGTVLLHHLEPREGFSRRDDAGLQCLASRTPADAASHRPCRRDATQCQSPVRSASIFFPRSFVVFMEVIGSTT